MGNYLNAQRFPVVVLLSPTRVLAKQNFERIAFFLKNYKSLLIDSDADGTRDVAEIRENIDTNDFVFLSSTYKSIDVIEEAMQDTFEDAFVCVDECHNIDETVEEFIDYFPKCLQMRAPTAGPAKLNWAGSAHAIVKVKSTNQQSGVKAGTSRGS